MSSRTARATRRNPVLGEKLVANIPNAIRAGSQLNWPTAGLTPMESWVPSPALHKPGLTKPVISAPGSWKQEDQKFVILGYIASSRPAWATRDLDSKQKDQEPAGC